MASSNIDPHAVRAWARHLGVAPETVDPATLRAELAAGTIPGTLADAAQRSTAGVTVAAERRTYAELHDSVTRAATALLHAGTQRGTHVAISAPTSMRFVIAYLAALHAGATVVLANPAYTASELDALLVRSGARLLLTDATEASPVETRSLAELVDAGHDPHPGAELHSTDVALLAYTSGTTGTPKGVPLTHGMLLASVRAAMRAWRWNPDDTLVHALPMYHQHGLSGLHASVLAGSNLTVRAKFDPHDLIATVERERASVVFAVPSIHQRLAALEAHELRPLGRLRLITSGSAPLSAAVADDLYAKAGLRPLERYGLTESGLDVSNVYEEPSIGTVGVPLPGVEVELRAPDGSPAETEGEIVLRGPQIFNGYLDNASATADAFWPGGWFRTGDLGRWDDAGRLAITGRLKELIITGGMNVAPQEVEAVVESCPGVGEAAVAGVPSERWGEEVTAWVVSDGLDESTVVAHCRDRLAAYKCPKRVIFVDALPRNAMGKIVRSELSAT